MIKKHNTHRSERNMIFVTGRLAVLDLSYRHSDAIVSGEGNA